MEMHHSMCWAVRVAVWMPRPGAGESPAAGMWLASDCPSSVLQLTFGAGQAPHLAIDLKAHKGLLQWSLTPGNFALLHVCPAHSVLHQNDSMPGARSGQGVLFLSHQEERQKPTVCALRFQAPQACRECAALLQSIKLGMVCMKAGERDSATHLSITLESFLEQAGDDDIAAAILECLCKPGFDRLVAHVDRVWGQIEETLCPSSSIRAPPRLP
ncbi:hypothetical protein ACKKBG_A03120 [Auxenochlorella protothecoides x Auxenochlorella symbiontica]